MDVFPLIGGILVVALAFQNDTDSSLPFRGHNGRVVVLDQYPFVLALFAETLCVGLVAVIVPIRSRVEWTRKNRVDGGRTPVASSAGFQATLIHNPSNPDNGLFGLVQGVDQTDDFGLVLGDGEGLALFVVGVPVGNLATVPDAIIGAGHEDGADSLRGRFALQFRKDQDDFEHGFAHRGAGIELFVLRHEDHAKLFQLGVHDGKVQKVTADTVDFPDQQVRELAGPHSGHHLLIVWTVGIFGRVACILENHIVRDAEGIFCIVDEFFSLDGQTSPVNLILR